MTYEKAVIKAEMYTKRSSDPEHTYEVRVYKGNYADCYVVQMYGSKECGIAAY